MNETDPTIETEAKERTASVESEGARSIESYETDECVVLYDSDNPRAWIQSKIAVDLEAAA